MRQDNHKTRQAQDKQDNHKARLDKHKHNSISRQSASRKQMTEDYHKTRSNPSARSPHQENSHLLSTSSLTGCMEIQTWRAPYLNIHMFCFVCHRTRSSRTCSIFSANVLRLAMNCCKSMVCVPLALSLFCCLFSLSSVLHYKSLDRSLGLKIQ
jgi:hypothetical protein